MLEKIEGRIHVRQIKEENSRTRNRQKLKMFGQGDYPKLSMLNSKMVQDKIAKLIDFFLFLVIVIFSLAHPI